MLPHRACKACGFYRGRTAVDTTRNAARLVKRVAAKKPVAPAKASKKAAKHDHDDHEGHDHSHEEKA